MAKVSKVNVAITGDSSGLAKATDQAQARLRRLRAENERMRKGFAQTRSTVMQAGEAVAKFGVANRALGMAGGALGLASLGPVGIGLGLGGAAIGLATAGAGSYMSALAGLPAERQKAIDALAQLDLANARSLASYGLTNRSARALAALPEAGPGANTSFMEGMMRAIAVAGGGTGRVATAAQVGPAAIGAALGAVTQGAPVMDTVAGVIGDRDLMALTGTTPNQNYRPPDYSYVGFVGGLFSSWWSK